MLKNNPSVSACSLSSCRLKAEALARALNSRIWPCTWVGGESSGDGMSAPDEEDDLYFDASPSPIEDEDPIVRHPRHDDSSAATDAGRARLYELLQQHVSDDATEVFYDVSEDDALTGPEHAVEMCRTDGDIQRPNCCECPSDGIGENGLISRLGNDSERVCHSEKFCVTVVPDCDANEDNITDGKSMTEISESTKNLTLSEKNETEVVKLDYEFSNHEELGIFNIVKDEIKPSDRTLFSDVGENSAELSGTSNNGITNIKFKKINSTENGEGYKFESVCVETDSVCTEKTEKSTSFPKTLFPKRVICNDLENASNFADDADHLDVLDCSEGNEHFEEKSEHDKCDSKTKTMVSIEVTEASSMSSLTDSESKNDSSISDRLHVFTEDRPMISRSTSLKTGKTPPGTPSRKKIVRFADVLGLDLEDVRHIMTSDLPNIPSSAYTDLVLSDDDKPIPTNEVVVLQNAAADSAFQSAAGANTLYPMFPAPGLMTDFMERVLAQGICLESVSVSDLSVQCTCRVMNWGFKKRVVARYTVNDWASSNDIDASYIAGSTQDDTDSFSFNIFLSPFHKNVKFALRYQVNGKEYWDNNKGDNYCLGYHSDGRSSPSSSQTWFHQFW